MLCPSGDHSGIKVEKRWKDIQISELEYYQNERKKEKIHVLSITSVAQIFYVLCPPNPYNIKGVKMKVKTHSESYHPEIATFHGLMFVSPAASHSHVEALIPNVIKLAVGASEKSFRLEEVIRVGSS